MGLDYLHPSINSGTSKYMYLLSDPRLNYYSTGNIVPFVS